MNPQASTETDATPFKPDAYLERLHLSGNVQPTESGLEAVHRSQAYTIPFENFDILLGRGITLEPGAIFDKLVRHRRGGYCFELNALFLMALEVFGFEARPLLARVHISGNITGRNHQLLMVTVHDKPWIADVGFGGPGLRAPIPFELDRLAVQDGLTFRLVAAEPFGVMLQTRTEDRWQDLYSFDLGHVFPADIACGNHYTATHPSSFFTYARVAALPGPTGRTTLFNATLKTVAPNGERTEEISEGRPYLDALKNHFGIELDAPYDALRPMPR